MKSKRKQFNGNPINQMTKETLAMGMGGLMGGMASSAIGKMGAGATGTYAQQGISTASSMMPAMGAVVGAKAVIGMTGQLMPLANRMKPKRK